MSPRRILTRSRVRRLRTAGVTGFMLGATVVFWGPIATGPSGQEVNLEAAVGTPTTSAPETTTAAPPTTAATTTTAKPRPPAPRASAPRPRPTVPAAVVFGPNHRYGVGYLILDLTDTSRPTPAAAGQPQLPGRHLPTIVRYPTYAPVSGDEVQDAAPANRAGPFPLVVFAHGFNSSPAVYAGLLHAWASAGYIVAAPSFPLTTAGGPLDENDVVNQPGDLSFVITTLIGMNQSGESTLSRLVDVSHIAAAGHSDGGETVMGIAANSCCLDHRLSAAIELSGAELTYPNGSYFPGRTPPLLAVQGDHDPINDYSYAVQIYDDAPAPKFLLTLLGGGHLEPFTTDTAHLIVTELCTIDFLDHYLKGSASALTRLIEDAPSMRNATLQAAY